MELDEISPGVCSSSVIEPSRNEDYDCFEASEPCEVKTQDAQGGATSTTWCNPRGSENECRFVCNDV